MVSKNMILITVYYAKMSADFFSKKSAKIFSQATISSVCSGLMEGASAGLGRTSILLRSTEALMPAWRAWFPGVTEAGAEDGPMRCIGRNRR
jgi:hypothetical protein